MTLILGIFLNCLGARDIITLFNYISMLYNAIPSCPYFSLSCPFLSYLLPSCPILSHSILSLTVLSHPFSSEAFSHPVQLNPLYLSNLIFLLCSRVCYQWRKCALTNTVQSHTLHLLTQRRVLHENLTLQASPCLERDCKAKLSNLAVKLNFLNPLVFP